MSKHDKTGRSKNAKLPWESRHVMLINSFRTEPAWKDLNASARVVYVELKSLYNGYNNGSLMASERHLAEMTGFVKNTVSRSLDDLQEAGFIVEMKRGIIGVDGKGTGTLWRLTELGCLGERPTKDFKKNRTPGQRLTQGGSKVDPQKPPGGSKVDPGWVKNCPGKAPILPEAWVKNCPDIVDVPPAAPEPPPTPPMPGGEFVGKPRRFTAITKRASTAQT